LTKVCRESGKGVGSEATSGRVVSYRTIEVSSKQARDEETSLRSFCPHLFILPEEDSWGGGEEVGTGEDVGEREEAGGGEEAGEKEEEVFAALISSSSRSTPSPISTPSGLSHTLFRECRSKK
jgi:hypothetical protein